jgi:hypothetical protein
MSGVNHGYWFTFCRIVSLGGPGWRIFDDGAEMHKYLSCTNFGIMVVPASDPKDLFVEHVTM